MRESCFLRFKASDVKVKLAQVSCFIWTSVKGTDNSSGNTLFHQGFGKKTDTTIKFSFSQVFISFSLA